MSCILAHVHLSFPLQLPTVTQYKLSMLPNISQFPAFSTSITIWISFVAVTMQVVTANRYFVTSCGLTRFARFRPVYLSRIHPR